jgi:uncharacterized protein (DUF2141 family)
MKKITGALLVVLILLVSVFEIRSQNMFRKASDFDGDGRADFAITRNDGNLKYWWIWQTTAGMRVVHWGISSDSPAASDYDGDGKTDIAVFRGPTSFPSDYTFYILQSQTDTLSQTTFTTFGNFGSEMMHQDYNGDGRADVGVVTGEFGLSRPLSVRYSGPAGGGFSSQIPAGATTIRAGDMDGGGNADVAYYTLNGNNVTIETNPVRAVHFGVSNDRYVMADFDGDGKGELALWRNSDGMWWWIRSSDGVVNAAKWGINGDTPVPADYDGDGKTDLAIWRSGASGVFWIKGSQNGVSAFKWGTTGDQAVQY